jgi:hypothetical protein
MGEVMFNKRELEIDLNKLGLNTLRGLFAIMCIAALGLYIRAQVLNFRSNPPRMLPAATVLARYRGHTFASYWYYPAYLHYFTKAWTINVGPSSWDGQIDLRYLWERDKGTNPEKYLHPDFYLCVDRPNSPCRVTETFAKAFPIVEQGPYWRIYDLGGGN